MPSESDIQRAVYRNAYMLYDNLGILVDIKQMPSYQESRDAANELYPKNRVKRWWLLKVQKKKWRRLTSNYLYWQGVIQDELANYLLDSAKGLQDAK